jgi:hypothetical protein
MVQVLDKFSLSRSARNHWVSCCLQDYLGLLECILLTNVPQELKEAHIARQGGLPDATKHPRYGLSKENRHSTRFSWTSFETLPGIALENCMTLETNLKSTVEIPIVKLSCPEHG